ncbi:MAG: hypothetical protein MUP70_16450 [Candidatus Aminicenantes bacterium]|nr:hypothetical protein [Candidatus Aminicenantes bacterium]
MLTLLTGPVHCGKTTLLNTVVTRLKEDRKSITGYLSLSLRRKGSVVGYDLWDCRTGEREPFLRTEGRAHWERTGPFFCRPETMRKAGHIIASSRRFDYCIIDEIGPLELRGGGIWPSLSRLTPGGAMEDIWVVREKLVPGLLARFPQVSDAQVCSIRDFPSPEKLLTLIEGAET